MKRFKSKMVTAFMLFLMTMCCGIGIAIADDEEAVDALDLTGTIGGDLALAFVLGIVVAVIACYFVLRNNKKHLATWLQAPEDFFNGVMADLGDLSQDVKQRIEQALNSQNNKQMNKNK